VYRVPNLTPVPGADVSRLEDRRALVGAFDGFRRELDTRGTAEGLGQFQAAALGMLTRPAVARAFDLGREDPRLRDRYGRHHWGQACLLARRLAEAGVGVVTIDAWSPDGRSNYPAHFFNWDDPANWDIGAAMRFRLPYMDQAVSALVEDIYDRGLDRKILFVAMGEFGRTPRLARGGGVIARDHWPQAQSVFLAGGGLRTGQAVGATNSRGEYPAERPLTPKDVLATIYHHLGVPFRRGLEDYSGRPVAILGEGEPVRELV
jgi:hypothetical protein